MSDRNDDTAEEDLESLFEADLDADVEEDPFEEMDVGSVDRDAVWEALVGDELETEPAVTGTAEEARETEAGVEHVIDKREYCQRCEYFAEPPETACTYEGAEVVEVVDNDQFRVRNCPMIGEEGPQFERE